MTTLKTIRANITVLAGDAVVNAAKSSLLGGANGVLDEAIFCCFSESDCLAYSKLLGDTEALDRSDGH